MRISTCKYEVIPVKTLVKPTKTKTERVARHRGTEGSIVFMWIYFRYAEQSATFEPTFQFESSIVRIHSRTSTLCDMFRYDISVL